MINKKSQSNVPIFHVQSVVLSDARLSAAAKLLFCDFVCEDGLRDGWLFSDAGWSDETKRLLGELGQAGYLDVTSGPDGILRVGACTEMFAEATHQATSG